MRPLLVLQQTGQMIFIGFAEWISRYECGIVVSHSKSA